MGIGRMEGGVCASIGGLAVVEMRQVMHRAMEQGAYMVELRLDTIAGPFLAPRHLPSLLCRCPLPAIVFCRPRWAGGHYDGDESQRLQTLLFAAKLGCLYVDVEYEVAKSFFALWEQRNDKSCKVTLSSNSFDKSITADELRDLSAKCNTWGLML